MNPKPKLHRTEKQFNNKSELKLNFWNSETDFIKNPKLRINKKCSAVGTLVSKYDSIKTCEWNETKLECSYSTGVTLTGIVLHCITYM